MAWNMDNGDTKKVKRRSEKKIADNRESCA